MMLHSLTDGFFRPLTTVLALTMLLTGCQWPADPERSLTAARERGALRVGVVANPPWVEVPDPAAPVGLESELVREFAERQDLDIQWHHRGVEQLVESLRRHELDLLIGGFSATHPWRAEVGQTFIYFNERNQQGTLGEHVILTAPGENALLLTLERFLFTRQDPEHYLPTLRAAGQP